MTEPRRAPEVPRFPFPDEVSSVRHGTGDWFGPVMIGVAVLVVLAVGFGMLLAVFPDILGEEDSGGGSSATAELTESLEADYGEEDWYEMIEDVTVEDGVVVVRASAADETTEGLDAMCEAVLDAAGETLEEPAVSVVSDDDEELVTCPE